MLHGFEATGDGLDQRRKVGVDEQHFVAGVVDDVHHVVRSQADVDGVNDGADGGRGEVGFQVPVGVPAEGADAVAESDAQFAKRVTQPGGALEQIGVGVAMRPVVHAGDDLLFGELDGRAFEDAMRQQFVLHRHG